MSSTPPQAGFTFKIKNPGSTRNLAPANMVAMKRIENYSYALNDEIGLGFTSHVYKGKCENTNKFVAIKVILLKNDSEDELHANFLKEEVAILETIKNLNSINLLKLEKVIKSKNNLYIITEFCEGNDLAKILRKKKRFNEQESQTIMKQFLNGYGELAKLRIVHRDLKLANLFISKGQVKIADFGFAIGENQCGIKMDYNVGSPYYMSPEALKENIYSLGSDVWAIGVMAYQLMYGRVPWKDQDDSVLFEMVVNCPVERLFDSDKEVSEHYKNFIRSCLVVDPRRRPDANFLMGYQWPLATDYIDGLNGDSLQNIPINRNSAPRISGSNENIHLKKMNSLNSEEKINRRRTPSVDNFSGRGELSGGRRGDLRDVRDGRDLRDIPDFRGNVRVGNVISQSFIQQPPRIDGMSRERSISREILIRDKSRERIVRPQGKERDGLFLAEKAILAQMNLCRFMGKLITALSISSINLPQIQTLKAELTFRISQKMHTLSLLSATQENLFSSPDFPEYTLTPRWQSLKLLLPNSKLPLASPVNTEVIPEIINILKNRIRENLGLLELLTYYWQIREGEGRVEGHLLEGVFGIQGLVDVVEEYNQRQGREIDGDKERADREGRLLWKLGVLGI